MNAVRGILIGVLVILIAISWRLIPEAYVAIDGITVPGTVIAREESFQFLGNDRFQHLFTIHYRYRPIDAAQNQTSAHEVDTTLYDSLNVGDPVQVRYSRSGRRCVLFAASAQSSCALPGCPAFLSKRGPLAVVSRPHFLW